jgi:hypothetical protein
MNKFVPLRCDSDSAPRILGVSRTLAIVRHAPAGRIDVLFSTRPMCNGGLDRLLIASPISLRVEAVHQVGQRAEQVCAESSAEASVDPDP